MLQLPHKTIDLDAMKSWNREMENKPTFILAIGEQAARFAVGRAFDTPIILGMLENGPFQDLSKQENVTGVMLPSDSWIDNMDHIFLPAVERLFPDMKRLGLIVGPGRRLSFNHPRIKVQTQTITEPSQINASISRLASKNIDGLLLLSDSPIPQGVMRKVATRLLRSTPPLPVIGDMEWHSKKGAAVSIPIHYKQPNYYEYGRQTGFLTNHIRLGLVPADPRVKHLEIPIYIEFFDADGDRSGFYINTLNVFVRHKVLKTLKAKKMDVRINVPN